MMGMHGEAWVNHTIQEADLLIALGMRFDDRVTGNLKTYAPNAKKIHVEIDPAEINKNVKVDVALVGDLRAVLREMLPKHRNRRIAASGWHIIDRLKGDSAVRDIQNLPDNGHLYAAHVINDLWRETRGSDTDRRHRRGPAPDVGSAILQAREAALADHFRRAWARWDLRLPAAIGAKVARPEAEVWVVVGDGGFQMTMAELATIVQENLKINIAIINNGYLGMVRQWQEFFYDRNYQATPLLSPNFVKLADAYGIRNVAVTQRSQVVPAVAIGAQARRAGADRFPGRTGRFGLSHGRGRRRLARNDPAAESDRGDRGRTNENPMLNTFVVYVENKPGVLTRVASLFRRRAFNIDSLTVGRTEKPEVSRMTITVDADHDQARRIEANLYKLVNVSAGRKHHGKAGHRPRSGDDQSRRHARGTLARARVGECVSRARGGCCAGIADHRNHRRRRQN